MTNPSPEITPTPKTDLDNRIQGCLPGAFPWDDWQRDALASGLDAELAALGRAVMREAYQHDWCDQLKYECGIDNPGTAAGMISCAKDQPHLVEARWNWLLATDGLRFDPWKREEWPETAPEWRVMRRRWEGELHGEKPLKAEETLRREACFYVEEFYRLNQLAIIDLSGDTIRYDHDGTAILWGNFTVISSDVPQRVSHSGVVRIEMDAEGLITDHAIFERVEES